MTGNPTHLTKALQKLGSSSAERSRCLMEALLEQQQIQDSNMEEACKLLILSLLGAYDPDTNELRLRQTATRAVQTVRFLNTCTPYTFKARDVGADGIFRLIPHPPTREILQEYLDEKACSESNLENS